ncbi:MAG: hypothetical protein RIC35_13825 [Marinoscillum sp.]
MGDQLERFVINNREHFDKEEPSEKVWQNINQRKSRGTKWVGAWKVAAILLLISTVYLVFERKVGDETETKALTADTEFEQVEAYYTTLIAQKRKEIAQFRQQSLERDFLMEIDRLDQMYDQLKRTYKNQNSSDLITDAMISNLQLRINILNKQLEILQELKRKENENDSAIES